MHFLGIYGKAKVIPVNCCKGIWQHEALALLILDFVTKYRVIHKSLRNFRTRLRNNQDIHGRKGRWPRPASSFRSAQAATLLEFHVPLTNCFVRRWVCAVHGPKPPLHRHN